MTVRIDAAIDHLLFESVTGDIISAFVGHASIPGPQFVLGGHSTNAVSGTQSAYSSRGFNTLEMKGEGDVGSSGRYRQE